MIRRTLQISLGLILVLLLAVAVVGCSAPYTLVGTWVPSISQSITWTFAQDGAFTQKKVAEGGLPDATGTYSFDGKNLTMTIKQPSGTVTTTATVDFVNADQVKISLSGMSSLTLNRKK